MAKRAANQKPPADGLNEADIGASFMAWYADAIAEYPDGLITQAQAARILGIGRMSLSRLVARGHIRTVYFPKEPDVVGVSVGQDDPTWLKLIGRLGLRLGLDDVYAFPQACYVSFADVVDLWERGDARKRCERDWNEIIAHSVASGSKNKLRNGDHTLRQILKEKREAAEREREARRGKELRGGRGASTTSRGTKHEATSVD